MTLLVIDEACYVIVRQRGSDGAVAIAVFGNAMHDDESGLRRARDNLIAGEVRSRQGLRG